MATSRNYYIFKCCQGIAALVFIFKIFTNSEICGELLGKQYLLLQTTADECHNMTLFGLNIIGGPAPDHQYQRNQQPTNMVWRIKSNYVKDVPADVFPARKNFCIDISLAFSYKSRFFTLPPQPEQTQAVADQFIVPIACSFLYMVLLLVQIPCKYNYILAILGFILWTAIFLKVALLGTYWNNRWLCSNFKATIPDAVCWSLFISAAQVIGCAIEICFNLLNGKKAPPLALPSSNAEKPATDGDGDDA